jgi:hypothetical protein
MVHMRFSFQQVRPQAQALAGHLALDRDQPGFRRLGPYIQLFRLFL